MQTIGAFLERFKNFTPPPLAAARAVCGAVKQVLGVEIKENQVRVIHGVAHIAVSGTLKSEMILKKKAILQIVTAAIGGSIRDLR